MHHQQQQQQQQRPTAAVRRALELGTTAVAEVQAQAVSNQRSAVQQAVQACTAQWQAILAKERAQWQESAAAASGELAKRFEAAANLERTTAVQAAVAHARAEAARECEARVDEVRRECLAAQRAAVEQAVVQCNRDAEVMVQQTVRALRDEAAASTDAALRAAAVEARRQVEEATAALRATAAYEVSETKGEGEQRAEAAAAEHAAERDALSRQVEGLQFERDMLQRKLASLQASSTGDAAEREARHAAGLEGLASRAEAAEKATAAEAARAAIERSILARAAGDEAQTATEEAERSSRYAAAAAAEAAVRATVAECQETTRGLLLEVRREADARLAAEVDAAVGAARAGWEEERDRRDEGQEEDQKAVVDGVARGLTAELLATQRELEETREQLHEIRSAAARTAAIESEAPWDAAGQLATVAGPADAAVGGVGGYAAAAGSGSAAAAEERDAEVSGLRRQLEAISFERDTLLRRMGASVGVAVVTAPALGATPVAAAPAMDATPVVAAPAVDATPVVAAPAVDATPMVAAMPPPTDARRQSNEEFDLD